MPPRIVVKVMPVKENGATRWQAQCRTGECDFKGEKHVVKVAAEDDAKYHRAKHRTEAQGSPKRPNLPAWHDGRRVQNVELPNPDTADRPA